MRWAFVSTGTASTKARTARTANTIVNFMVLGVIRDEQSRLTWGPSENLGIPKEKLLPSSPNTATKISTPLRLPLTNKNKLLAFADLKMLIHRGWMYIYETPDLDHGRC